MRHGLLLAAATALAGCGAEDASPPVPTAAAEQACVAAVERAAGTRGGEVASTRVTGTDVQVIVRLPGRTPWACLANPAGAVAEVMDTASNEKDGA